MYNETKKHQKPERNNKKKLFWEIILPFFNVELCFYFTMNSYE